VLVLTFTSAPRLNPVAVNAVIVSASVASAAVVSLDTISPTPLEVSIITCESVASMFLIQTRLELCSLTVSSATTVQTESPNVSVPKPTAPACASLS